MSRYEELVAEIGKLNSEVKGIFDQSDATGQELDTQSWEKVKTNNMEIERLEKQVAQIIEQQSARKAAAERGRLPNPAPAQPEAKAVKSGSAGMSLLDDAEFKAWRESIAKNGVTRAQFGNSPRVDIPGGMKALITGASATSAGALVDAQYIGFQAPGAFMRPLTVRDLVTNGATDSDAVDFVRQTSYTNNAAPVAEATATSGSSGAKPESDFALELVTANVKTIAHFIAASRRALADASQLRTLIDTLLRYGLEEELEEQILVGSGVGENFTGIMNTTGTTTQAYDTSLLITTRRARTKVRVTGRANPTAYVMHPNDWEDMDLLQDAENRYYFGGPSVIGNPRLWGLPVVESEAMTEGFSIVADWRLAILWDRMAAQVLVSDSHSDFFIRNLIAILAELRAAFGVLRPAAFVEIDLTA